MSTYLLKFCTSYCNHQVINFHCQTATTAIPNTTCDMLSV